MSKREEFLAWRENLMKQVVTPEEAVDLMRTQAQGSGHRLEFLYDPEAKTVLLQGDVAGLEYLRSTVSSLLTGVSGSHAHFNDGSGFTKGDLHLIIQRVDEGGKVAHSVNELDDQ